MPRPLRIEYEDAWYHVMNRGTNRQVIFKTNEHRQLFLALLEEISRKFHIEIHAYCLMDNHYHLLVRTPLANLSKAMQYIDGVYTQRLNRLIDRDGPLFRGRYKAILVEADGYLLQLSRYIHLNPLTAKITSYSENYIWSSYQAYINLATPPQWLHTSFILSMISEINPQENYAEFISAGIDDETNIFYKKIRLPSIRGSNTFINEKLKNLDNKYKIAVSTDVNNSQIVPDIDDITQSVTKYFNTSLEYLKTSTKGKKNDIRLITIYLARYLGQLSHQQIASYFTGITRLSISNILRRFELKLEKDDNLKADMNKLVSIIHLNLYGGDL